MSLLAGRGLAGRGAIRVWLGTVLLLCASSAIEAQLRSQGGSILESATVGQALAVGLSGSIGKLLSLLLLLGACLLGLFWIFGRPRQPQSAEEPRELREHLASAQPSVARRTQLIPPRTSASLASSKPLGAAARGDNDAQAEIPTVTPFDYLQRRRTPTSASTSASEKTIAPAGVFGATARTAEKSRWPKLSTSAEEPKKTARPASEWAPFESLRPTEAMLARAGGNRITADAANEEPALGSPIPTAGTTASRITTRPPLQHNRVRVSNASDRSNAITTSLRATLQAQLSPSAATPALNTALSDPLVPEPTTVTQERPWTAAQVTSAASAPALLPLPASLPGVAPVATTAPVPATAPVTAPANAPVSAPTSTPPPVAAPAAESQAPVPIQFHNWTASPDQGQQRDPSAVAVPADDWQYQSIPLPDIGLLDQGHDAPIEMEAAQLQEIGQLIEQRLKEFKVPVTVLGAYAGPVITRFEIEPALGVRGAQIVNLMKDLARALGLTSIRVVETIPGKTCMGLELPNPKRQMIRLAEIIRSDAYTGSASHLTLAMGKDITGVPVATDLARAPHMLVAGTTGSGKSVAINAMILSLLYKATPDDVRLIMIDPKMLELSVYDGIPHLLAPVVTDMKLAAHALSWCVAEMDKRYRLMSALGVRNLAGYNQKIRDGIANEKRVKNPFSLTPDAPEPLDPLPMIVVVIDELADLMMVAGKKIEELIARLAQKARAAGIHLILATQRPSVDVITGLIKANIPTRVAFQVSSKIDSRTVLDQMGAETLLGHGDMLFLPPGSGYPQRVHGAFVSDEEVHRVVEHLKAFGEPQYEEAILAGPASEEAQQGEMFGDAGEEADPLYDEAVAYVTRSRRASISSVQRQVRIGYNRAARLVEQMEAAGILSAMSKSGGRDVLAPPPPDL